VRALAAPVVWLIGAFHGICSVAPISDTPALADARARIIKGMPPPRRQSVKGPVVIGVRYAVFRQRAGGDCVCRVTPRRLLPLSFIKGRYRRHSGGGYSGGQAVHGAPDRPDRRSGAKSMAIWVYARAHRLESMLFTPVEKPVDRESPGRKRPPGEALRVFSAPTSVVVVRAPQDQPDRHRRVIEKRNRLHGLELRASGENLSTSLARQLWICAQEKARNPNRNKLFRPLRRATRRTSTQRTRPVFSSRYEA
jgi:hypothetical protein